MDTGKNKMVGMRKKRALRGTLFAVILSASMSFSALAAMTADGNGDSGRGISRYFRQYGQ